MHLSAIKLRGFKSFPDPVEVRLERGVAVVVGPNGSGKSNVSDALLWASGSLSPSELRAEKAVPILESLSANPDGLVAPTARLLLAELAPDKRVTPSTLGWASVLSLDGQISRRLWTKRFQAIRSRR